MGLFVPKLQHPAPSAGFEPVSNLKGVITPVPRVLLFVSLAGPHRLAVLARPGFVRALSRPPFNHLLRQVEGGGLSPRTKQRASRRTYSVAYSVASGAPPRCRTARCQPLQVACSAEVVAMLVPAIAEVLAGLIVVWLAIRMRQGRVARGSAVGVRHRPRCAVMQPSKRPTRLLRHGRAQAAPSWRSAVSSPRSCLGTWRESSSSAAWESFLPSVSSARRRASGPPDPCCEHAHTRRSLAGQVSGP
jgi:hypothetical protein